jgi:23S rRNA-/tRNA-specific pseudouridylate synthase
MGWRGFGFVHHSIAILYHQVPNRCIRADPRAGTTVVCSLADGGKEATTRFVRLSVAADRRTSVVQCEPLTGRTHQVRVTTLFKFRNSDFSIS